MMIAAACGQLPAGPALDFARNQLGRLSFAFGAFVNPPLGGVDGRTTSHPDAAVDDIRRMYADVAMNSQLSVADVGGTAQGLGSTDSICPPDTAVLDQPVAQPSMPIATLRKTTVRGAGRRVAANQRVDQHWTLRAARRLNSARLQRVVQPTKTRRASSTRRASLKRDLNVISPSTITAAIRLRRGRRRRPAT